VGFLIALPYFAVMESRIGGGQSVGKRWLKLRVVDARGCTLSLERCFARYAVFSVPYFLNGLALPITCTSWAVIFLLGFVIFGVGGSTLYLMTFNRHTRQGLHDLAVGSYVAKASETGAVETRAIWTIHWVAVGLIFALTAVAGIMGKKLTQAGPFPELLQDAQLVEQIDGIQQGGAFQLTLYSGIGGGTKKILVINVSLFNEVWSPVEIADKVAELILQNDRNIQQYDLLRIEIRYGYDLGISHATRYQWYAHTPDEWRQRVLGASPTHYTTLEQQ
jgi:uncharacterized RDD family membrane protein YckC